MPERGYPSGPAPDKLPPLPPSLLDVEHGAWQKRALFNGHEPWWGTGSEIEVASTFIALPAVVLWEPA